MRLGAIHKLQPEVGVGRRRERGLEPGGRVWESGQGPEFDIRCLRFKCEKLKP